MVRHTITSRDSEISLYLILDVASYSISCIWSCGLEIAFIV